jgi:hypothetical protein
MIMFLLSNGRENFEKVQEEMQERAESMQIPPFLGGRGDLMLHPVS